MKYKDAPRWARPNLEDKKECRLCGKPIHFTLEEFEAVKPKWSGGKITYYHTECVEKERAEREDNDQWLS